MYICKNEFIICVPIYSSACCWKPRIISHGKFYYSNEIDLYLKVILYVKVYYVVHLVCLTNLVNFTYLLSQYYAYSTSLIFIL